MSLELGSERFEGDKCSELGDVGFGVEDRGEEEIGFEPERVSVRGVGEEVIGRSVRWCCRNWIHHFG